MTIRKHKRGDKVMIFDDPLTCQKVEGTATVLRPIALIPGACEGYVPAAKMTLFGVLIRYQVQFEEPYPDVVERQVFHAF